LATGQAIFANAVLLKHVLRNRSRNFDNLWSAYRWRRHK